MSNAPQLVRVIGPPGQVLIGELPNGGGTEVTTLTRPEAEQRLLEHRAQLAAEKRRE